MTLREKQDQFIADMEMFDNWTEKFNYLISESDYLPPVCPAYLFPYRLINCSSNTCFRAQREGDIIRVNGWSNSPIMGGFLLEVKKIFNFINIHELADTEIDFHIKSGLFSNLTPMRQAAVEEIIRRITVLYN